MNSDAGQLADAMGHLATSIHELSQTIKDH